MSGPCCPALKPQREAGFVGTQPAAALRLRVVRRTSCIASPPSDAHGRHALRRLQNRILACLWRGPPWWGRLGCRDAWRHLRPSVASRGPCSLDRAALFWARANAVEDEHLHRKRAASEAPRAYPLRKSSCTFSTLRGHAAALPAGGVFPDTSFYAVCISCRVLIAMSDRLVTDAFEPAAFRGIEP